MGEPLPTCPVPFPPTGRETWEILGHGVPIRQKIGTFRLWLTDPCGLWIFRVRSARPADPTQPQPTPTCLVWSPQQGPIPKRDYMSSPSGAQVCSPSQPYLGLTLPPPSKQGSWIESRPLPRPGWEKMAKPDMLTELQRVSGLSRLIM